MARRKCKHDYYYHVTSCDWPTSVVLRPTADGENRGYEEPELPRTCVGPTVSKCLCSIPLSMTAGAMYVYRTKSRVTPRWPYRVYDYKFTGERWLTRSVRFVKVATISTGVISKLSKLQSKFSLHCASATEHHKEFIDYAASALKRAHLSDTP